VALIHVRAACLGTAESSSTLALLPTARRVLEVPNFAPRLVVGAAWWRGFVEVFHDACLCEPGRAAPGPGAERARFHRGLLVPWPAARFAKRDWRRERQGAATGARESMLRFMDCPPCVPVVDRPRVCARLTLSDRLAEAKKHLGAAR
jgi:hypothetical protein